MGLAGNKKRSKLSHDPNNTAWSKSTDGFGHKILSKQGWQPGQYLGAENASHGDHYTAANASHIRVLLREENLGIGAKVGGKGNAETFGLSTLSGIFGRLNGKSDEEVEKKQGMLRDAELRSYQVQKYGFMNFVRGGLLVGDKIEEFDGKQLAAKTIDAKSAGVGEVAKVSKKRKAEDALQAAAVAGGSQRKKSKSEGQGLRLIDAEDDTGAVHKASKKGRKEARKREDADATEEDAQAVVTGTLDIKSKEERRKRKEARRAEREARAGLGDEKARLRQEKRARKEDRRKRKEKKAEKKRAKAAQSDVGSDSSEHASATTSALPTASASELPSGVSTPVSDAPAFRGRNVIRQRYIQQKRMASMDPRALNEILMIKAQS